MLTCLCIRLWPDDGAKLKKSGGCESHSHSLGKCSCRLHQTDNVNLRVESLQWIWMTVLEDVEVSQIMWFGSAGEYGEHN